MLEFFKVLLHSGAVKSPDQEFYKTVRAYLKANNESFDQIELMIAVDLFKYMSSIPKPDYKMKK